MRTANAPITSSPNMGSAFPMPDAATDYAANATKVIRDTLRLMQEFLLISKAISQHLLLVIEDINDRLTIIIWSQVAIFVLLVCIMFMLRKLTSLCKSSVQGNERVVAGQH
jgi:hypothetical protein